MNGGKPPTYLVPSLISVCCCCLPAGVVGLIYATRVDSYWNAGKHAEALDASNKARLWSFLSMGIAATCIGLIFILNILSFFIEAAGR